MKSTRTDAPADQRVEDTTMGVASLADRPTLGLGGDLANTIGILSSPQNIGEYTLAHDMEDDGISPGDALEVMSDGDSKEVRA